MSKIADQRAAFDAWFNDPARKTYVHNECSAYSGWLAAKADAMPPPVAVSAAAPKVVADERQAFEKLAKQHDWNVAQAHGDGVTRWLNPTTRDLYLAFLEGRATLAAAPVQAQEPVAWSYECKQPLTDPAVWCEFINRAKPSSAIHVRNIKPLYVAPAQPVDVPQETLLLAALNNIAEACNCCGDRSDLAGMAQEALDEYADLSNAKTVAP